MSRWISANFCYGIQEVPVDVDRPWFIIGNKQITISNLKLIFNVLSKEN